MNEGAPISWIWMAFPLVGLTINLVWPRKRALKIVGIVLLLLTAYSHGFLGLNPLDRAVGLAERIVTGQEAGTPEEVVSNLRFGQALAHQTMFDVSLGLILAVVFAATPVNIIARIRSRSHARPESDDESQNDA
jgi:hypothetical protein